MTPENNQEADYFVSYDSVELCQGDISYCKKTDGHNIIDVFLKGSVEWNKWVADNPDASIDFIGHIPIDFENYHFPSGKVSFSNLGGDYYRVNCKKNGISFKRAIFNGEVEFRNIIFDANVDFTKARFKKSVHFRDISFLRDVNFYDVEFDQGAIFKVKFNGETIFTSTKFKSLTMFDEETEFNNKFTCFNCAHFFQGAILKNIVFNQIDQLNFLDTTFDGNVTRAMDKELRNF